MKIDTDFNAKNLTTDLGADVAADQGTIKYDVELVAVSKSFGGGGPNAVDGISLRIPKASYCCLLGPSGCGKTTTLRMLAAMRTSPMATC